MPSAILDGSNLSGLRRHFEVAENISSADIDQIVIDAAAVFDSCLPSGGLGASKGLIYGNIQSGKTAVILALLAIAADNGYTRFVVLTSDLNDLYVQTLDRVRSSLHGLTVLGKVDMKHPANANTASPCALVVSKNVKMLKRAGAIVAEPSWAGKSVLMIDDEADQASLDTAINKPLTGPSGVNREISALRAACNSLAFVQTTATPQALLLQDANNPYRPDTVHVTTPGTGYCGGNVFFIDEDFQNPKLLRFVQLIDIVALRANKVLPASMEDAIYGFVVSAAALRVQGSTTNYQALLHTSLKQKEHALVTPLIDDLIKQITIATSLATKPPKTPEIAKVIRGLKKAYRDLATTLPSRAVPSFSDIAVEIAACIPSTSVIEINSATGQGVQPNPNRRHIIYVGGAKLGRGVTIKNLLMTYYARDAISPQIDTVLQHARMYGYRQRELPFTRIFLPSHLAERFRQIHVADNSMRDIARETGKVIPVIPIPIRNLRASRRNVLSKQSVELTTYLGGRQYYPLVPISKGVNIQAQTRDLDAVLRGLCPKEREPYDVSIAALANLLQKAYGEPGAPGAWDDSLVQKALSLLEVDPQYGDRAQIIVGSRSSSVSKLATRSQIPQIQALLPANAGNPPFGSRRDVPVLVFMRLIGDVASGWDGIPFWVPNVRFPEGNYAFSLNRT
jgi:hypothetical protein